MRSRSLLNIVVQSLVFAVLLAAPVSLLIAQAPTQAGSAMSRDDIAAFARIHVAVGRARDSVQLQLAEPRNNTTGAQQQLRDQLRSKIDDILRHNGVTGQEFRRKTYVVSTDAAARRTFDSVVAQVTGVPTPGQLPPAAPAAPRVKVPTGVVGTHLGHVVIAFGDTPNGRGLLPTALAEAQIAIQHAALAARAPTNLDAMKLHAGHVINALDPSILATGPGLGYGVKRASLGVAMHVDLAATAAGASPNVVAHANHVATSARNTAQRCDQAIALAQRIQATTSAADAAALVNQLVSLTQQLVAGVDTNGDGRVTWEVGEGGLQQAQEHVTLLLAGEHLPPS